MLCTAIYNIPFTFFYYHSNHITWVSRQRKHKLLISSFRFYVKHTANTMFLFSFSMLCVTRTKCKHNSVKSAEFQSDKKQSEEKRKQKWKITWTYQNMGIFARKSCALSSFLFCFFRMEYEPWTQRFHLSFIDIVHVGTLSAPCRDCDGRLHWNEIQPFFFVERELFLVFFFVIWREMQSNLLCSVYIRQQLMIRKHYIIWTDAPCLLHFHQFKWSHWIVVAVAYHSPTLPMRLSLRKHEYDVKSEL